MHEKLLPSAFSGLGRLFPLPNLVLFPAVVQPLHIFEPRYRQLMADALGDDRLITMALLKAGWEAEYESRPAIHDVVCIGQVFNETRLGDGRYNLLLHGLGRARVLDELPRDRLYRVARLEVLEDDVMTNSTAEDALRGRFGERLHEWFAAQPVAQEQLHKLLRSELPLGALCDIFAFALPIEAEQKQELLAELAVERRVVQFLERLALCEPAPAPPADRKFPPDFSTN
jgi:Lon protease-like protein